MYDGCVFAAATARMEKQKQDAKADRINRIQLTQVRNQELAMVAKLERDAKINAPRILHTRKTYSIVARTPSRQETAEG